MNDKNELPPAGRAIVSAGAVLGLIAGCAAIFLLPVNGILLGVLLGKLKTGVVAHTYRFIKALAGLHGLANPALQLGACAHVAAKRYCCFFRHASHLSQ